MKLCSTTFRILCHLFCLFGCAFQIFHITTLYFERHSVVDTSHRLPVIFKLPTISLCFETTLVFNDSAIYQFDFSAKLANDIDRVNSNSSIDHSNKENAIYKLKKKFVDQSSAAELELVTKSFASLVDGCKILSPKDDKYQRYIECDELTTIEAHYQHIFKCFTMFMPRKEAKYNKTIYLDTTRATAEKLLTISTYFKNPIQIHLNSNDEFLVYDQHNFILLDFTYYRFVQVWYTKTTRRLLPHPYETNCKNFSSTGAYVSRQDCIWKCAIRLFQQENDIWPRQVPCPTNVTLRRDYKWGKNIVNIEKYCITECENKDDCYRETFTIQDSQRVLRETNSSSSSIELLVQKGLEKIFTLHPKLDIVEYYSYIASTIGLWYGISVIAFTHNKFVKKMHVKLDHIAEGIQQPI